MRSHSVRQVFLLPLLVTAIGLASHAQASLTHIGFENFNDGDAVINVSGALFSHATAITAGVSLNEAQYPPHSGQNVVFDDGGPITVGFQSATASSVSGYFTYTTQLTLRAFDNSNNVLQTLFSSSSDNRATSGVGGNELLQFSVSGIDHLLISGAPSGSSFTLDDFSFQLSPNTSSVPELPASTHLALCIGLFGSGLAGARHYRTRCRGTQS